MNDATPPILIVDDEPDMIRIYADTLRHAGYSVLTAFESETALALARTHAPAIILLDILLPNTSGLDLLPQFLAINPDVQVIMLTILDEAEWAVQALRAGAYTYLTKSVSIQQVVKTIAEAWQAWQLRTYRRYGDLAVDLLAKRTIVDGQPIVLTPYEWAALECLAQQPAGVSYEDLWAGVWDHTEPPDKNLIQRTLSNLRQKIGETHIETVRGWGYRLV
ncbi:MAG TPA: response regulator transcription factor [Anaerolineae bacterium]|nr:response regulator transcription factor [Anaerolineae bacterium]